MIIYQAQKSQFLHDVHHRDIEEVILEAFRARTGHKVSALPDAAPGLGKFQKGSYERPQLR